MLTASGLGLFVLSSTAAGLCVSFALGCLALGLTSLVLALILMAGADPVIEVEEHVDVEPEAERPSVITAMGPTVAERLREPIVKRGGRR